MTWRKLLFHPLTVLAIALIAAVLFALAVSVYHHDSNSARLCALYYHVPIVVPFVMYLLDRAERWSVTGCTQRGVDLVVLALSLALLSTDSLAEQPLTIQDCISLLRQNNPRLVQLKTSIEKSGTGVTSAYSSYYPNVDLSTAYRNEETFSGERDGTYSTSISVGYPIYSGGYRGAAVKAARAGVEAA